MVSRFTALTILLVLLLQLASAQAAMPSWLGWVTKVVPIKEAPKPLHKVQKQVWIESFTGGTGTSAGQMLRDEMTDSREFHLCTVETDADYIVSGSSVGGRVTGKLRDKAGKALFERNYAAPGLDDNLKALSDDVIFAVTGRPGLATSQLVFVSDRSGTNQIYICDSDGGDVQQVTRSAFGAVGPSLSPDGSVIAYTSYKSGFPIVEAVDLGVGWERTVTDTPGSSFGAAFSPDGQRLAMVMSFLGNPEIFVTDMSSNTAGCISDTVGVPSSPSWSPDGKQVMFSDDRGNGPKLYVAEVPTSEKGPAKLYRWRTGYSSSTDPEWSPDGSAVAFTSKDGGEFAVVVKEYPSGGSKVIQGDGAQHPSWSPNGRYLCYCQRGNLYVHDLRSGNRRLILSGYGKISEPRWMR